MNAAAYARYSTDRQQATSITAQLNAITNYCLANNLELCASFVDEAQSGTNMNRQGFRELLASAKEKKFEAVVIYDVTRGSRDVADWFTFRKEMMMLGVKVFSVTEKLGDISRPGDFITEAISVVIGQHQVLQSREKSIAGKKVRAAQGLFCGGWAPIGYRIQDGRYMIEPQEAEAVRIAFEWYADGRSYNQITAKIRAMGVVGRQGQPIGDNTLYFILRNERYRGCFIWFENQMRYMHKWVGKPGDSPTIIEDAIPRIISDELWERVQKRVSENRHNRMNNSKLGREYLLSGIIHCAKCGSALCGHTSISKGKEYSSYICGNKSRKRACTLKDVRAERLEVHLMSLLRSSILNGDMVEKTAEAIIASQREHVGVSPEDIKREIASLDVRKCNLLKTLEDGFDSQSVRDRIGEIEAQQKLLRDQLKEIKPPSIIDREALIAKLQRDAKRLLEDDEGASRELLKEYIVRIDVDDEEIVVHAVADLALKEKRAPLELIRGCTRDWLPR